MKHTLKFKKAIFTLVAAGALALGANAQAVTLDAGLNRRLASLRCRAGEIGDGVIATEHQGILAAVADGVVDGARGERYHKGNRE